MKLNYYFILLFLIVLSQSCSKNDSQTATSTEEVAVEKKVALTSSLAYVSNGHTIGNVQVGDTLTYNYDIVSNVTDGKFYIVPETTSAIKHQKQNTDFTLFYNKLKCDTVKCLTKSGKFKVLVNRAGNFQNTVTAVNFIKSSSPQVYKSNSVDVLFNAVRIVAYSYNWNYYTTSARHHWQRYLNKLYIDNGNQQNDTYLQGLAYQTKYLSKTTNNTGFVINSNSDFFPSFTKWGSDNLDGEEAYIYTIYKITFNKTINNINSLIEYDNIPVYEWGEHPDWGDNGNNNL